MNVGVYASTCIHFMCIYCIYMIIYMFIYSGISTCREERPSAWHHQGAAYDPKRPAGIAQWQKPRTARSSKSVPIYWPPKKFGWIFSIEAQTTGMRTWLDVLTVGKNSMEGRVGLFFSKTRVALPVELEKLKLKTKLDDYAGDLLRSTWALHCQTGSGYCQSTWRVRGRSGWILWHLVLDHPQEWCMWDDLPLEGVDWVWQVCPSVGGSLMGAGYSGWGPWWLIHHPWRQCLPLNILRIPKRPIYFPYDLGFIMGSVWEGGSHFLGVPAIFLCFDGSWNSWQLLPLWIQIWTNGNSCVYDSWFSFWCTPFL